MILPPARKLLSIAIMTTTDACSIPRKDVRNTVDVAESSNRHYVIVRPSVSSESTETKAVSRRLRLDL